MMNHAQRKAFEEWAAKENASILERNEGGEYVNAIVDLEWLAWQAAIEWMKDELLSESAIEDAASSLRESIENDLKCLST